MPYVWNTTEQDIVQMHGGVNYTFPARSVVAFKDLNLCNWFSWKTSISASPADKREAKMPLRTLTDEEGAALASEQEKKKLEPVKAEPLAPLPSTHTPEVKGHVAEPDPEVKAMRARKALNGYDKERLVKWCKASGLYQPYMDRPRMIEALARAGFKPPPGA